MDPVDMDFVSSLLCVFVAPPAYALALFALIAAVIRMRPIVIRALVAYLGVGYLLAASICHEMVSELWFDLDKGRFMTAFLAGPVVIALCALVVSAIWRRQYPDRRMIRKIGDVSALWERQINRQQPFASDHRHAA